MTLYDYITLMPEGEELTVWDSEYDVEVYFYGGVPDDRWSKAMSDLSKLLTITGIRNEGVIVNLSEVIEKHIDKLTALEVFESCDTDIVMDNIEYVLAGNVDDNTFERIVNALS